jgi:hypothetical protein
MYREKDSSFFTLRFCITHLFYFHCRENTMTPDCLAPCCKIGFDQLGPVALRYRNEPCNRLAALANLYFFSLSHPSFQSGKPISHISDADNLHCDTRLSTSLQITSYSSHHGMDAMVDLVDGVWAAELTDNRKGKFHRAAGGEAGDELAVDDNAAGVLDLPGGK